MRRATGADPETERTDSRLLAGWRGLNAYVLLGDPGAGKTEALKAEAQSVDGWWLDARNVVAGIASGEVAGRTVFIDGLDEVRAGAADGRVPFDAIRKWLHDQGHPRFRVSCREADWHGPGDGERLAQVAPGGKVVELHLDPLTDEDIEALVRSRPEDVADTEAFLKSVQRNGLHELLRNPLLLDLTIKAQAGGTGPRTRAAIYESACRQLAAEHNREHLETRPLRSVDVDQILADAGLICAIALLSGQSGVALNPSANPGVFHAAELSEKVGSQDATAALASKVFTADAGSMTPRHRSIAEYLGARSVAQRISQGLPLGRVISLMQGIDGVPVNPLRGLWAWLAVHHAPSRARLIAIDPLGFVLNGDAAVLTIEERLDLLDALRVAFERDPWLRRDNWISHPLAPLATQGLAADLEASLRDPRRDRAHLSFVDCLFDALQHGEPLPSLDPVLRSWIEAGSSAAYGAWKRCHGFETAQALAWLHAINADDLPDEADQLCGELLQDLYPQHVTPEVVLDFYHPPKRRNVIGEYWMFWRHHVWAATPRSDYPTLMQAWLRRYPASKSSQSSLDYVSDMPSLLLAAALKHAGDDVSNDVLYAWLGIALDAHGFSRLEDREHEVRDWLAQRPDRMKAVMAIGLSSTRSDTPNHLTFSQAESRLHGAQRPRDWHRWLLDQAANASTPELAEHCFSLAAWAALSPTTGFDSPSMDDVESWVEHHEDVWPQAKKWLEDAWSTPIDHWQGTHAREEKQHRAQELHEEEQRRKNLDPYLPRLLSGTAPVGLLYQVAMAHENHYSNLRGDTALERVRKFLVSDESTAQRVIDALPRVLDRDDLPSANEAIALEEKSKQHYVRPAALLAARLTHERDPQAALSWPQALVERLVAYYLTDGTGDMPVWYRVLAQHRPEWVAPVLVRYARKKFKRKGNRSVTGLWALRNEGDHAGLARLALPALLDAFPSRASEAARQTLNQQLLSALSVLDSEDAAALVRTRLAQTAMDPMQRLCWLVADLPYRASAAEDIAALVGRNERRAVVLGAALHDQGSLKRATQQFDAGATKRLFELLAPIADLDQHKNDGWVTRENNLSETVHGLLSALSSNPLTAARTALSELASKPSLRAWRENIEYHQRIQEASARAASFRIPSVREVSLALAGLAPVDPADLRALVMQHLDNLVAVWRGSSTFALKEFWCEPGKKPKVENDCRDLLLERLGDRLKPLNIHVGRECSAARDKRMDMCAEFMRDGKRVALPIELKKEDNGQLWTAWRDQLQSLYAIDPDAQGFGLYLVLWFGMKVQTHPEGFKPRSAGDLQRALEQRIPPENRHRLAVQVLDLSWPQPL
jgi:hypothetical protein